jgi:hypothetical protein
MLVCVRFVVDSGTLTGFSPSTLVFPLSVLSHQCSIIVCIYRLILQKEETEVVSKCSKGSVVFEIGGIGQKNTPFFTWPSLERVLDLDRCAIVSVRVQADGRPTAQLYPGFPWFYAVVEELLCYIIRVKPPYVYLYNCALQPFLKAYCAIWVRRSNFRHQAYSRVSPRESTQRRKLELLARNIRQFCLNADLHVIFRDLLHAVKLRHGTDGALLPLRRKTC